MIQFDNNTWPSGSRHAMDQSAHEEWNASYYPGTRQLCWVCSEPTGRCEDDSIEDEDGRVYCEECAVGTGLIADL